MSLSSLIEFAGSRAFQKCIIGCNLRNFYVHIYCLKLDFAKKYLDFCKFAIFFQIIEVEPKGFSKTLSNDPGLYHNKKMEGGREKFDPSLGSQSINQKSGFVAFSIREVMIEYV